jgi:hypothetical protein
VRLSLLEQIANAAGADADKHLDEIRTRHGEEGARCLAGYGPGEQRLSGARRTNQKGSLGKPSAELGEFLRVLQEFDDFLQLELCLVASGDIGESDLGRVTRQQLRLRLAEGERLGPAGLHLPENQDPEPDEQKVWQKVDE